ncbi:MAG: hypothetical protein K8L99_13485 [Anaerolineae bacterium]|nr:hypothetical protein [Anaerolineae bacterium]
MALYTIDPKQVRPLESAGTIVRAVTMSGASQLGRTVYFSDDETVSETDALDSAKVSGLIGMIVAGSRHNTAGTVVDGERVTVLLLGPVWLGDAALDISAQAFLADETTSVDGRIADAAGTVTRRIGSPMSSEILFFNGVDQTPPSS